MLGLENRNPWNVKQPTKASDGWWEGSTSVDTKGHAIFIDPVYSARACVRQLSTYQHRDGLETLNQIFQVYAPESDGNAPNNYAAFVAKRIGRTADEKLVMFQPNWLVKDKPLVSSVLAAMLEMECCIGLTLTETISNGIILYNYSVTKSLEAGEYNLHMKKAFK